MMLWKKSRFFLVLLLCWLMFVVGCVTPPIRTAETLKPGQASVGVQLSMTFPDEPLFEEHPEDTAPIDRLSAFGLQMILALGLPANCDVLLGLGGPDFSLEGRCGFLQEREGLPLSLAPGVGMNWVIGMEAPGVRAFVDVSRNIAMFSPLMRIEASYEYRARHHWRGTEGLHREQGPYLLQPDRALLLNVTFGTALTIVNEKDPTYSDDDETFRLVFGVTPRYTLYSPDSSREPMPDAVTGAFNFSFIFQ